MLKTLKKLRKASLNQNLLVLLKKSVFAFSQEMRSKATCGYCLRFSVWKFKIFCQIHYNLHLCKQLIDIKQQQNHCIQVRAKFSSC